MYVYAYRLGRLPPIGLQWVFIRSLMSPTGISPIWDDVRCTDASAYGVRRWRHPPVQHQRMRWLILCPHPPEGKGAVEIFESVDKIRQIIHNSASGNISRAKTKQAFYFRQRHRGVPLQIGKQSVALQTDELGQWLGDKLHGRWIGPYIIFGMTGKK